MTRFLQCSVKLALQVLYMLWQMRLSVHLSYSGIVSVRERRRMRSSLSLVFSCQEWLMGDNPVQVKFECKEVDPCENSRAVHILPHNSGTVIDSEKSSINANRKSIPWAFQTSRQPSSCIKVMCHP